MSMNGHARRTIDVLEGLGFEYVRYYEGKREYVHPNDPTKPIRIPGGISDMAARRLRNLASEVAGYSAAGERTPGSVRDNAKIKRLAAKERSAAKEAAEARARAPFERAAEDRAARLATEREVNRSEARRREMVDLMMPGSGR